MIVRAAILASLVVLCTSAAGAQTVNEPAPADGSGVAFLSRFAVHLEASHLVSDDERYVWDAEYAGEADVVDYSAGRVTLFATYHMVLGEQLQLFDPNQGNYILGGLASARLGGTEAALVFYHQSRHMSDRLRPFAVAWNMVGARVTHPFVAGRGSFAPTVDIRRATQQSFVDYRWEIDAYLRTRHHVRGRLSVISEANVRRLGVDGHHNRGAQTGARGEAGVRLEGRRAALELFVAAERRIDPYPLETGIANWVSAGFRLTPRSQAPGPRLRSCNKEQP